MGTTYLSQLMLVGAGGFIGSALRYVVSGVVYRAVPFAVFPYGTLVVNVVGCLMLGLLAGAAEARAVLAPEMRLFLLVGVLGGFTTFSTFGYETVALLGDQQRAHAFGYVASHLILGIGAAWLGYSIGRTS